MASVAHIEGMFAPSSQSNLLTEPTAVAMSGTSPRVPGGTTQGLPGPSSGEWNFSSVRVVAGALVVNMVTFGWVASTGFFINYYKTHRFAGSSDLQLSWLSSISLALMYIASWPIAWLSTITGPTTIIAAGSATHLLGLVLLARSTQLWSVLLTQGFVTPLGASMVFNATIPVIAQWFRHGNALPIGITAAGGSIGGVIYPILIHFLLPVEGFENTLLVAIATLTGLFILVAILVRSPTGPNLHEANRRLTRTELVQPFKECHFMVFSAAGGLFLGGYAVILAFIVAISDTYGVRNPWRVLVVMNASSSVGRILPLILAEWIGRDNIMILSTGLSSVLTMALLYPLENPQRIMFAFAVSWGISAGAFVSLLPAMVAQNSPHAQIGLRIGITYCALALSALTWPGAAAALPGSSYSGMVLFSGVSQLAASLMFVIARCLRMKGIPTATS